MKGLFQGICIGLLIVMGAAHADVGREEELDDAVRQFAAKVEAVWQQCLSRPDVHTTNDSDMCLSAMVRTSNEKVEVKYQEKLVKAQQMTESPDIFSSYEKSLSCLRLLRYGGRNMSNLIVMGFTKRA